MALAMVPGELIVSDQSVLPEKATVERVIFCDSCGHSFSLRTLICARRVGNTGSR